MVDSVKEKRKKTRCPCFSPKENLLVVKLIDKYKQLILNKSTSSAANHAKEVAWIKLTRQFNDSNLTRHKRSVKNLRRKWENLQRNVKNISKNLLDSDRVELDEVDSRIMALMAATNDLSSATTDSIRSADTPQDVLEEEIDKIEMNDNGSDVPKEVESDESESDDDNEKNSRSRSQNFSPQESKLLLDCVRKEKNHVFCKEITSRAIEAKNQAWSRIANSYNKLSPQERSVQSLRMKFASIQYISRKFSSKTIPLKNFGNKHEELINDSFKGIKKEPLTEEKMEDESDHYSDQDDNDYNDDLDGAERLAAVPPDPLSAVLNGDSGIGSTSSQLTSWNWRYSDNKEIMKLQSELLNYQMETAKLERKRIEEAIVEEARERESRATERALRLRAARLDAVAAASRLPPSHPAVQYRPEEARALQYLNQYQETPIERKEIAEEERCTGNRQAYGSTE